LTGAVLALAGGVAIAGSGTEQDARGDVMGRPVGNEADYDIASSAYGQLGKKKLRHSLTVVGHAVDPQRHNGIALPILMIDVPKVASQTNYCDFFVGRNSHGDGPGVYECGDQTKRGSARVVRTSSGTLRYVFSRKAIANPKKYGWAFGVRSRTGGSIVTHDRLPDRDFDVYRIK
jgi:hypothetical protein